jgi:ketosteroid isomerase-like protein
MAQNNMNNRNSSESQIRKLIEDWAAAARKEDMNGVLAHHSKDIVMYDVPYPFQSVGIEAYKKTWDLFFSCSQGSNGFEIVDLNITAGEDVAFCYAAMKCAGAPNGNGEDLPFRLTVGLVKEEGEWIIRHEHHSVPSE